ncbi:MEDS: MEthanogen/methylotroph, DcmR Sensory domain [Candidatus Nitrososphaera evergladensis SR1]|uniref:MEDS: MEthanogen/methylotroph, DcmR Sensory domain n=1 Tax=Candidatus Nitrososphaera evergladensis SR1 TaxID=1459636 RepID=A0A075MMW7_9ARCH|nr:MEDS domain-containing protein [Candidatus Nitrososphaera evergladensis]AIF82613.1 MEDS: MEthanogen/methylotroph, DcmR Sensory domain [Candidatus Nitrososphaera evergladensis SR1]
MTTTITHPLDFIVTLDSKPMHIALFYEDEEYAREIEYAFLKNGLAKSQHCIYTTHGGDADIERIRTEMIKHGIDVSKFEPAGFLHILKISDPRDDPSGFERGIENLKNKIVGRKKPPIRLVSRFIKEVESEDDARANMLVERTIHSRFFDDYQGGLFMCPYPVDKVPSQVRAEWFLNHMQHHHAAVFAPKYFEGSGLVLERY